MVTLGACGGGGGGTSASGSAGTGAALGSQVTALSAGELHTCARKADGTLWCWGNNAHGQLGGSGTATQPSPSPVSSLGGVVAEVAAGHQHTCARKTDGTLLCWGATMRASSATAAPWRSTCPCR